MGKKKNLKFGFISEREKPAAGEEPSFFWIDTYAKDRGNMAETAFGLLDTIICLWMESDLIPLQYANGFAQVISPFLHLMEDLSGGVPRVQALVKFEGDVWEQRSDLYTFATLLLDDALRHEHGNDLRVRLFDHFTYFKNTLSYVELWWSKGEAALHEHPKEMALALLPCANDLEEKAYDCLLEHVVFLSEKVAKKYHVALHPSLWSIRRCVEKEREAGRKRCDFARFFPVFMMLLDCVRPLPFQKKDPSAERTRKAVLAMLKECAARCKVESPTASLPDLQQFLTLETNQVN